MGVVPPMHGRDGHVAEMQEVRIQNDFDSWREEARRLLAARVEPSDVVFVEGGMEHALLPGLFTADDSTGPRLASDVAKRVPKEFVTLAKKVTCHRDPVRWNLLYRLLWRLTHGEPRLYEVARSLQMSQLAVIFKIALPSASPDILAGMRLSLTVALILSVVCEILAGLDGLGHWVLLSSRAFRSADLFAGVILLGVTGYVTSVAMSFAESRLLAWQAAQR